MAVPAVVGALQDAADPSWGTSFQPAFNTYAAGDLLVIIAASSDAITGISGGTGWSTPGASGSPYEAIVYFKIAASSSDTIPTFNLASFTRYSWTTFHCTAGSFDATTPIDAFTSASGTSDNPVAPSTTPTGTRDHNWIMAATHGGNGSPAQTWTAPGGATLVGSGHSLDYLGHAVARAPKTTSGATGTAAFGFGPANDWHTISFLIRPSAGGTPQSVALVPATVTVTPVALTPSPGAASVALVPATVTVTPVALTPSRAGSAQSVALVPAVVHITPVALTPVAPELATDIEVNEIWIRETAHPEREWRTAVVGPQGTAILIELRSEVPYDLAAKAIRTNGASRWSEWNSSPSS